MDFVCSVGQLLEVKSAQMIVYLSSKWHTALSVPGRPLLVSLLPSHSFFPQAATLLRSVYILGHICILGKDAVVF